MTTVTTVPRILIYLLRRDLRLSDNPVFFEAAKEYSAETKFTHFLPIYVFAAQQIEISGFLKISDPPKQPDSPYPEARSQVAGYWRCGPHRAKFLAESVWDLKESLEHAESGLVIRAGLIADVIRYAFDYLEKPKDEAHSTASPQVGRAEIVGVWMTGDVTAEERLEELEVQQIVEGHGKEFRLFTDEKFFVDDRDLPFEDIKDLPDVYTTFRKSVEPLRSRPKMPLRKPSKLPPLPPTDLIPPPRDPFVNPTSCNNLVECLLKPLGPEFGFTDPLSWQPNPDKDSESAHPFLGGESQARNRLDHLLRSGAMTGYKNTRNGLLGLDFSTKLSGWLALGCISARQVHAWMCCFEDACTTAVTDEEREQMQQRLEQWKAASGFGLGENPGTAGVRFELLWRDYMRLVAKKYGTRMFLLNGLRGSSPPTDYQSSTAAAGGGSESKDGQASKPSPPPKKWQLIDDQTTREKLSRFRTGTTGTGLIDASLRELLRTGYTSNRARQNVASFLSKHLNIDWRLGSEWYECMLIDYDCASNWGNWQYVAGVGNDPRQGRMFNPVKQGLDYDSRGEYVKAWVPELRGVEISVDAEGKPDEEALMGVFQAWRLPEQEKQRLGLKGLEWVEKPLVKIPFNVGRKPRIGPPRGGPARGRGGYRGRGRGRGWRGRGSSEVGAQEHP